jgi:hypothetical protein
MMLYPATIGFQGRGLLVTGTLGQVEINQLAECQRLALFLPRRSRIAASRDFDKKPSRFAACRLRRPGRTVFADRQPPFRRAAP